MQRHDRLVKEVWSWWHQTSEVVERTAAATPQRQLSPVAALSRRPVRGGIDARTLAPPPSSGRGRIRGTFQQPGTRRLRFGAVPAAKKW